MLIIPSSKPKIFPWEGARAMVVSYLMSSKYLILRYVKNP